MRKKNWIPALIIATTITLVLAFFISAQAKKVMSAKDFINECKQYIKEIAVDEAKTMLDSGQWTFLDVRTEKEYKRGHLPNAVHLQRGLLEFKIEKKFPDKSAKIIVYCKSGSRSALAVCTLKKMGYTNVVSLRGGWKAWVKTGLPIG